MPDIVLTTLNAKYAHAAFGLRYLLANLGPLAERAVMLEFDIAARTTDAIEAILAQSPKIVGVGVYIWNVDPATQLVAELKRLRPELVVVLGGPEVSYETDQQEICRLADYVITGEADLAFADLCGRLLASDRPATKIIAAELPEFEVKVPMTELRLPIMNSAQSTLGNQKSAINLPYSFYTNEDLAHRVIYVEASRGCPFKCEFCLSSLDVPVRNAPLGPFLEQMQNLLDRGCRQFKFVDRTFNLNLNISKSILKFFLDRYTPGLFLHFEMIPDRLPEALRELIAQFEPGALQFEVGVQSLNDDVQHRISRKQDNGKLAENLLWLREHTGVHVHADLIVGLPGENLESFGRGFDRLVAMRPQEIQVGILKRLRGTPIVRHDEPWGMVYSPHAPYEVLQTSVMDFNTLQRLRRFSRYWDLIANSGNFVVTLPAVWGDASPFESFLRLSDWLFEKAGRQHGISLTHLTEMLFRFLTEQNQLPAKRAAEAIWADYQRLGRSDRPAFLKDLVAPADTRAVSRRPTADRQARHLAK